MLKPNRVLLPLALAAFALLAAGIPSSAQPYPNPYRMVDGWAKLPEGRTMGAVGGVTMDPDGKPFRALEPKTENLCSLVLRSVVSY